MMTDEGVRDTREFFLEIISVAPEPHVIAKDLARLEMITRTANSEAALDSIFVDLRATLRKGGVDINTVIKTILEDEENNFD